MEQNNSNNLYIQNLYKFFGSIDKKIIQLILDTSQIIHFNSGDYLFQKGEKDNSFYIILSGRCRAIDYRDGQNIVLGDIAEGEPAGEFALFTSEPRTASVLAIRPTVVLQLDEKGFHTIVSRQPEFATLITKYIIGRLRRNALQAHLVQPPKNIAVLLLQPDLDISNWTAGVKKFFENINCNLLYYTNDQFNKTQHQEFFKELEENKGLNFMICCDHDTEWSEQSLVYSDLILVISDFYADSNLYNIEKNLNLYNQNILNKKTYLLLLHPDDAPLPQNTKRWLEKRNINLHIHLRNNYEPDIKRCCRIIMNQGIGLVLGGGGAKGFAHVGAVKAMLKEGIEIDFLGGTSAGALYGLGMAFCDFNTDQMDYYTRKSAESKLTSHDFSIPLVSFMTGKKFINFLQNLYNDTCLEDLWINTYCVSTNYSEATIKIHKNGPAWKQVAASIAIPGVFPPVVIDGKLHVDGGVMDNLPIEPMYQYPVKHIIAISLSGQDIIKVSYESMPSGWTLLWDKLLQRKKYKTPGIISLLVNSLSLNSRQKQEYHKLATSLYIELNLKGVGMMDDSQWEEVVQKGYDQMNTYLQNIPSEQKFW